ncbi:MAG: type II toxin-antitoxin system VapC family toxin [Actinomycetota bacterium]
MTTYLDSSAWLKRYIEEEGSELVAGILEEEPVVITCAVAEAEVRRNLERIVPEHAEQLRRRFLDDLVRCNVVEIDRSLIRSAAALAEITLARSLDALHLAAAQRLGGSASLRFLTFDRRQSRIARDLGLSVAGIA